VPENRPRRPDACQGRLAVQDLHSNGDQQRCLQGRRCARQEAQSEGKQLDLTEADPLPRLRRAEARLLDEAAVARLQEVPHLHQAEESTPTDEAHHAQRDEEAAEEGRKLKGPQVIPVALADLQAAQIACLV